MPLQKGNSSKVVSSNIKELVKAGHSPKEAIAISLASKRKYKKMAEGGMVNSDFDMEGTPEPVDAGDEEAYMSQKPSAAAELNYRPGEEEHRSLVDLDMDGDYHTSEVANPMEEGESKMFAEALSRAEEPEEYAYGGNVHNPKSMKVPMKDRFAMGGLVEENDDRHMSLGTKPSKDVDDSIEDKETNMMSEKASLDHSVRNDYIVGSPKPPRDLGVSQEAMEAIRNKRMKRRYPIA